MPIILIKAATPSDDPLIRAAESMEPKLRDAFVAAVNSVRDSVTLAEIADAIEAGDAGRVMSALKIEDKLAKAMEGKGLAAGVKSVRDVLQAAFASGAEAAMRALPSQISVDLSFNLMNPKTVEFLNEYSFGLIREVNESTVEAIRSVVVRAFERGGHPLQQAREIRNAIGLTSTQEATVARYRSALESGTSADLRNALGRALRDGRYDRGLLSALSNNAALPQARIDVMVDRYRARFVNYRAQTIARTESLRASNKGQRALWKQAQDQDLLGDDVLREWEVSGDKDTCDECMDLDGQTAGLDEEFAPGVMEPPDPHPDCRCTTKLNVASLRKRDLVMGYSFA